MGLAIGHIPETGCPLPHGAGLSGDAVCEHTALMRRAFCGIGPRSRNPCGRQQAAVASVLGAPLHAFTSELLESTTLWGSRLCTPTVATTAAAAQCRVRVVTFDCGPI